MDSILQINDLSIGFHQYTGKPPIVNSISFEVKAGETFALVGESGSGKSISALSILKLLPAYAYYPTGSIIFEGKDLLSLTEKQLQKMRSNRIGMVFQEPMTALNPLHTVEKQIGEVLRVHQGLKNSALRDATIALLEKVRIPDPKSRLQSYPHELSGGQRQRVMIAMALANNPALLIADEPTTALDVTVQMEIMELLNELKTSLNMAILLITHDLGIVRHYSQNVAVMRHGCIVETNSTEHVFTSPSHEYTRELINSEPVGGPVTIDDTKATSDTVLACDDLNVRFALDMPFLFGKPKHWLNAVHNVSITLKRGHTLGIVGESGSGKSTLALALLRLLESSGPIEFMGEDIAALSQKKFRPLRQKMQVVFQDPFASLSPRMTIGQIIAEGLAVFDAIEKTEQERKVKQVMQEVGLDPDDRHRYPHEFSGGQRQRVAIARAIVLNPELLFLDEPTSALDRAIQVQIIDLLRDLQKKRGLSYIFISHDLHSIRAISHDIIVMRSGNVIEQGTNDEIFTRPQHDYTKTLLAASLR